MRPGRAIVLGGKKFVTECSLILFLGSVSCSGSSSSFPGSCLSSPSRRNLKIKQKFDQCGIQVIRRGFQFNGRCGVGERWSIIRAPPRGLRRNLVRDTSETRPPGHHYVDSFERQNTNRSSRPVSDLFLFV